MIEPLQSGAGEDSSDAGLAVGASGPEAATRPSVWGGHRGRAETGSSRFDAQDASPPGEMRSAMSAAVQRAREAARLEWLHSIPDDPNERQRIADDLRP